MDPIDTTQPPVQPQTYPPGSAIPADNPPKPEPQPPEPPPQAPEGIPERRIPPLLFPKDEPEPPLKKKQPTKKKVAVKKKEKETMPMSYPFKSSNPKRPRAGATRKLRGPSIKHAKSKRSSMSRHGLKGRY